MTLAPEPICHICRKPWTLTFSAVLALWPGPLAIIFGSRVSSAFTVLGVGFLAHLVGIAMCLGGALSVFGVLRRKHIAEAAGLISSSAGCALYALGVVFGLGLSGQVAGALAFAAALAMALAAAGIVIDARAVSNAEEDGREG